MIPGFEGGQLRLLERLPHKRGFTNIFCTEYCVVHLAELSSFEAGSEVDPERLLATGIVKSLRKPIKILADGDISHPLTVRAHKFSAAARAKIEAAGGKAEEVVNAAAAE
jgi:large subunit ribosomal protein L15